MNFEIFSNHYFKSGFDFHVRMFQVSEKKNGNLQVTNMLTGEILFDDLKPENVTISGVAMQSLEELQRVILNSSCFCSLSNRAIPFKYFDMSFDETFE